MDADTDLTDLMTEDEILMLESNKLDPNQYAVVALMGDLRVSEPDANGGRHVISQGYLPQGIVQARSSLLTATGESMNPFDGSIALPPCIRLVVRKDRMVESFLADLGEIIQKRVEAQNDGAE
jgi:hypothetical protein